MKSRIVASGVVALAIAGVALPAALSGSASAKPTSTAAPTVTGCKPTTATIGKSVTIHGTGLADATAVTIGTTKANSKTVTTFTKDSNKSIKFIAPKVGVKNPQNVSVTTPNGTSAAGATCSFQVAKKKKGK